MIMDTDDCYCGYGYGYNVLVAIVAMVATMISIFLCVRLNNGPTFWGMIFSLVFPLIYIPYAIAMLLYVEK